jgi:hypothetical protein
MVFGDEYTVQVAVHHLEADAMAKLHRQQLADLDLRDWTTRTRGRGRRHQHRSITIVDDFVARFPSKARDQVNFVDVDGNDILQRRC